MYLKPVYCFLKISDKNYKILSRKLNNLTNIDSRGFELIVNCCSREYKFNIDNFSLSTFFWDMNYSHTHNSSYCERKKIKYIDGLELLEEQARFALSFWNLKTN